jgi:hypothetical protein
VVLGACSSGSKHSGAKPSAYCSHAKALEGAFLRQSETTDWPTFVDAWGKTSAAWQALAKVSPARVRAAQERLAREAEDSAAGLRTVHPKSQQEMQAAVNRVAVAVTARDGNIDADAKAVQADMKKACGLSITSPPSGS